MRLEVDEWFEEEIEVVWKVKITEDPTMFYHKNRLKRSFQTVFYLFTLFQFRFEELLEFIKRNFTSNFVV